MARNARLNATLVLDTSAFQRSMRRIERDLQAFSRKVTEVGSTLTQSLTLPLIGVGAAALKSFADIEKLEKGMTAVTGSTEAAAEELEKLKIAARAPGLGFEEAVRGSIRLQAVGLSADEARQTLQAFGAAIAATGGTAENLDSVQYQLTQMISKNRILQEDFGILQENVPLLGKAMQEAFPNQTIEQIRATGISAQDFNTRLVAALQSLPEVQKATGGLANAFDNFQDELKFTFAELGRTIEANFDLAGILERVSGFLRSVVEGFKSLSPQAQKTLLIIAGIVAAAGPLLLLLGGIAKIAGVVAAGIKSIAVAFAFLTSPVGLTILGVAAVVSGLVILYNKSELVRKTINGLGNGLFELARFAKESFVAILQSFALLKEGEFREAAKKLAEGLKVINPLEQGKRFIQGFSKGFADNTNYLKAPVDKIKGIADQLLSGKPAESVGGGTGVPVDLSAQDTLRAQFIRTQKALTQLGNAAKSSVNSVRSNLSDLGQGTPIVNEQKEALLAYQNSLKAINDTAAVFATNPLQESFKATEDALRNAIVQFGPASEAVRILKAEYDNLKATIDETNETAQRQNDYAQAFASTLSSIGQNFSDAISGAVSFGKAVKSVLIDLISTTIQLIVVNAIRSATESPLAKLLGPAIVPVALAAGAAAGQLTKALLSTVKLAEGGLTTGQTLAIVGDNPSGREFIIPFERMGEFLSNFQQDGGFVAEARISGNDLALLVTRAERRTNRVR